MVDNCDKFHLIETGDSCATIASEHSISLSHFFAWNSGVGTNCGSLWLGYYVCVSVVGQDTPTTTTSSTTTTTTTTPPTNGVVTPTPTRPGMVDDCDDFHMVVDGDYCAAIADTYGISLARFLQLNPHIGADCSGLWLGYYVCVSIIGDDPDPPVTTTTTTTTTNTTPAGPSPTQSGLVESCTSFYQAQPGDTCQAITQQKYPYIYLVSLFVRWNPAVGSSCSNLLTGYYYCVATELHQPMPGTVANCRGYHHVKAGDSCWAIQQQYGITAAQFNAWNPLVGSSCGSLWQGYFICVYA
jgi:LysM repeat protein